MEPEPTEASIKELEEIEAKLIYNKQFQSTPPQTLKRVRADD